MLNHMDDEQWFDGRVEGGPDADACLGRERQLAPAVLGGLVTADDTGAIPYGCVMTVDVPGVRCRRPHESDAARRAGQVMGWGG